GTQVGSSKELSGMEIKQFQDEDGYPFYAKTHMDGIDGMEEYTEGLTQVAQILGDFIFDTGWHEYDTHIDVEKKSLYSSKPISWFNIRHWMARIRYPYRCGKK